MHVSLSFQQLGRTNGLSLRRGAAPLLRWKTFADFVSELLKQDTSLAWECEYCSFCSSGSAIHRRALRRADRLRGYTNALFGGNSSGNGKFRDCRARYSNSKAECLQRSTERRIEIGRDAAARLSAQAAKRLSKMGLPAVRVPT